VVRSAEEWNKLVVANAAKVTASATKRPASTS